MSSYVQYEKRSVGNILYFLDVICGPHISDHVIISGYKITLNDKHYAYCVYDSEGFPLFEFASDIYGAVWTNRRRKKAIEDWEAYQDSRRKQNVINECPYADIPSVVIGIN